MKIFRFFLDTTPSNAQEQLDSTMKVLHETVLLITKRPFFIPDFTKDCKAQLCYAVKIDRLGRSIHPQFSHRYYNPHYIALGVHFIARDLFQELKSQNKPTEIAVGFDNAVAISEAGKVDLMDDTLHEYTIDSEMFLTIDHQISRISSYYTLKQGDILLFPVDSEEFGVNIDNHITLLMQNQEVMSFNLK